MKTQPSERDVAEFLATVEPAARRRDAIALCDLFTATTGYDPVLWGERIIGFGRYDYTYDSGHSGRSLATGFAPRKANLVIYIMPGYGDFGEILARLGPHRRGKSCLYITRLDRIDQGALADLIRAGLDDLRSRWPVQPR